MLKKIIYGLLILMLVMTAAQRIPSEVWWIRVSDFPHLQLTVLTALGLLAMLLFVKGWPRMKRILTGLTLVALTYQLYIIYPYTILAPAQVKATDECSTEGLSILEANVYQENREFGRFIEVVEQYEPDIVIALETDQRWADTLKKSLTSYPHLMEEPLDNTYGMVLYSRIPFKNEKTEYRVSDDIPSFRLDLQLGERELTLYVVHPKPPAPTESDSSTQRDAELVLVGREASEARKPVIVMGDLNDVAWSHTTRLFQRLSGLLDPRKGRGMYNTFNANNILLRYPLDHIFHSEEFLYRHMERTPDIGSDHFPVYVELCLKPLEGEIENEKPKAPDKEDLEEGEEKVEKAGVK